MDRQESGAAVDRHMVAIRVISGALAASVVLHVAIAWWLVTQFFSEPIVELSLAIVTTVVVSGLVLILLGYLVGRSIRNRHRPVDPAGGGPGGRPYEVALQTHTRSVVVAAVFREAASVVGMTLSILTGQLLWVVVLSAATLISMTVHWPRRDGLTDWLIEQRRSG